MHTAGLRGTTTATMSLHASLLMKLALGFHYERDGFCRFGPKAMVRCICPQHQAGLRHVCLRPVRARAVVERRSCCAVAAAEGVVEGFLCIRRDSMCSSSQSCVCPCFALADCANYVHRAQCNDHDSGSYGSTCLTLDEAYITKEMDLGHAVHCSTTGLGCVLPKLTRACRPAPCPAIALACSVLRHRAHCRTTWDDDYNDESACFIVDEACIKLASGRKWFLPLWSESNGAASAAAAAGSRSYQGRTQKLLCCCRCRGGCKRVPVQSP